MPAPHPLSATLLLAGLTVLTGCGGSSPDAATGDAATDALTEAARSGDMAGMQAAANAAAAQAEEEGLTIEQIANPERLREYFPDTLAGLKRGYVSTSEPEPRSPYLTSSADAMYGQRSFLPSDQGGASINVSITDAGSMKSMLGMIRDGIDYSQDGDTAKSFKHAGYQGLETTTADSNSVELQLRLPSRLLLSMDGRGVDLAMLHQALGEMDIAGLAVSADDGTLAAMTEWQQVTLPSGEQLAESLPTNIGARERVNLFSNDLADTDPPHVMARGTYQDPAETRQPPINLTIFQFKSEDHATQMRPGGRDGLARQYGGFDEGPMTYETREMDGVEAEVLIWRSNAGIARIQHGRTVITATGPTDLDVMLEAVGAIDVSALGNG